jgi:hypothetical protein
MHTPGPASSTAVLPCSSPSCRCRAPPPRGAATNLLPALPQPCSCTPPLATLPAPPHGPWLLIRQPPTTGFPPCACTALCNLHPSNTHMPPRASPPVNPPAPAPWCPSCQQLHPGVPVIQPAAVCCQPPTSLLWQAAAPKPNNQPRAASKPALGCKQTQLAASKPASSCKCSHLQPPAAAPLAPYLPHCQLGRGPPQHSTEQQVTP